MKKIITTLFIVALFNLPLFSQGYFQPKFEKWDGPRTIFSPSTKDILKIENVNIKSMLEEKIYSKNKTYFYSIIYENKENYIFIYNENSNLIKITVTDYESRPITAKWINSKLLYFSVYFNPHFGAYWIYDVENEKIIIHELENDGVQAWQQYKESKK